MSVSFSGVDESFFGLECHFCDRESEYRARDLPLPYSAAPDLLEACKAAEILLGWFAVRGETSGATARSKLIAAIAKAEGTP